MSNEKITALYCRLSPDEEKLGEKTSIENQMYILGKYAEERGFSNIIFYVDSYDRGVIFERDGFQEMLSDIEADKISTVIVKDTSRFGRERIMTGYYTDILFPLKGIRFISYNDGFDSGVPDLIANEMMPMKQLFDEYWVKQTSKAVRSTYKAKAQRGEWVGTKPPYGYMKDPNAPTKHIVPNPETAPVVRQIFDLFTSGVKYSEIIAILEEQKIYSPSYYYFTKTGKEIVPVDKERPYYWAQRTLTDILDNDVYIGNTTSLKTEIVSYKVHKRLKNPPEKQVVTENTHEAIVDRDMWEIAQQLRANKRRYTKSGYKSIFAGLVYCADCGAKLSCRSSKNKSGTSYTFICSAYRSGKGKSCTIHTISEKVLNSLTLQTLNAVTAAARESEKEFRELVTLTEEKELKKAASANQKKLKKSSARLNEISKIIKSLYEDKVSEVIDSETFKTLNADYSAEKKALEAEIAQLEAETTSVRDKLDGVNKFVELARKYTEISELTTEIVNSFIEKIIVHERVKGADNKITQEIEFVFKGIGKINLEDITF